jgi:hypothetical protein
MGVSLLQAVASLVSRLQRAVRRMAKAPSSSSNIGYERRPPWRGGSKRNRRGGTREGEESVRVVLNMEGRWDSEALGREG